MYTLTIFSVFVAVVAAAPQQQQPIAIIKLSNDITPEGSFSYEWESANGQRAEARGTQTGPESQSVQGSFSFVADDGQTYQVQYLADENGFQPQGAHLPTPPPIPAEILKSLEFNAKNPEPEERQQQQPFRPQQQPFRPQTVGGGISKGLVGSLFG